MKKSPPFARVAAPAACTALSAPASRARRRYTELETRLILGANGAWPAIYLPKPARALRLRWLNAPALKLASWIGIVEQFR